MDRKFKDEVIAKYIELTGDTEYTTSRIVHYRACQGGYFKIYPGPKGNAKREELTYYAKALGKEDGYGWRKCTPEEEKIARSTDDHDFTREDPSTIGHVDFTKTPELLKIVEEVSGPFYIQWTPDAFHVEWERNRGYY